MRKSFIILGLVMALILAFAMPALGVKIAPYSQPLHDIMHWDARSAKLIINNPEGERQTVSWPATVDLWNYNGNYWVYDLPTGDKFAFDKEVLFGSAARGPITFTFGEPVVEIYGTCASTSGATNAMSLFVHTILSGEGQVGRSAEFVLAPTCVRMGAWGNAIKAKLDLSGAGVLGSIGLLAGVCAEIVTPAGQLWGSIAVVEHEIVATEGLALGHFLYSANTLTFLQFALSGHAAAVTEVDNHGQFFTLNGVTPLAGNMLSLGYVTLKGSVNDTKQMYLVMSRIEDGLKMGASGDALVLAIDIPKFQLYTTSAAVTGDPIQSAFIQQTMTVASNVSEIEALHVELISDVKMGAWCNAIMGKLDFVDDGLAHGVGAVYSAELSMPAVTMVVRGEYSMFSMDMDMPTGCDMGGNPVSLFKLNVWGGEETEFDDHGVFLDVHGGVTSTALGFFYEAAVAFNNCDAFLKIRIGADEYYIPLSDNQGGT